MQLTITGVLAEAYLYVDLDNVARIVDREAMTLDRNPEILTQVLKAVDTTVNAATGPMARRQQWRLAMRVRRDNLSTHHSFEVYAGHGSVRADHSHR